ncbi:unnamed protein product [Caretta caretta]
MESPPTLQLQDALRRQPPTPAAAQVPDAGGALAALHTIKRGISIDRTSISPETTQRVTSTSPDACPASETTQRDPRTLPDARPAGPIEPTCPHQDEPASDTVDAAGTPPLQGNEDTIYLQNPLAADVLICPICSQPRSFHLLGGVTRHLKRCHSKRSPSAVPSAACPSSRRNNARRTKLPAENASREQHSLLPWLPALLLHAGPLLLSLNKEKRPCKLPSRSLSPSPGQRNRMLRSRRYLLPWGRSPRSSPAGCLSYPLMSPSKSPY